MAFQITHTEKESIERFKNLKYPAIYKLDDTDNILFAELVDFDVCSMLLKGKPLKKAQYKEILNDYNKYLGQVRLDSFDNYAFMYHNVLIQVMEIFKKYYGHLEEDFTMTKKPESSWREVPPEHKTEDGK